MNGEPMIGQWLGVVGGVVGIVVFLGAVTVYLRGSYDTGTIKTLKDSNAALTERVDVLEESEHRLIQRVNDLERENARLIAVRPSAEAIAAIEALILTETNPTVRQILDVVKAEK